METKHKPATPLPWNMQDGGHSNLAHVERDSDGTQVCSINKGRVADAAFITHAANAYPQLVAALLDVMRDQLKTVNLHQMAPGPRQRIEDARALLRSLGEGA